MIWLLWILGVLLIAAIWCCIRFYDSIEQFERKLDAEKSRSLGLRLEVDHWISSFDRMRRSYELASQGLARVQAIGTNNMASIGKRMSAIAVRANAAAKTMRNTA